MREVNQNVGVGLRQLGNYQMGLWVADITKKISADPAIKNMDVQRKRGEAAVAADINKLFAVPDSDQTMFQDADGGYGVRTKGKRGAFFIKPENFVYTAAQMQLKHRQSRNSRGRVSSRFGGVAKEGNKTYSLKYWTHKKQLEDYIRTIQAHVGKTKSSWLKALYAFNARAKGWVKWTPPPWVTRHAGWGAGYGAESEQFQASALRGTWEAGSNVPWIRQRDAERIVAATGATRLRDLKSSHIAKRLAGLMEKNFPRAA